MQIHSVMKAHIWHESPSYYQSLLRAYCKYFKYSCRGNDREDKVKAGIDQLHMVVSDMESLELGTTRDVCILLAERSRCWSVLSTVTRHAALKGSDEYLSKAITSFESLLNAMNNHNDKWVSSHSSSVSTQGKKEKSDDHLLLSLLTSNDKSALVNSSSKISQNLNTDLLYDIIDVNADHHHHYLRDSILDLLCSFAKEGHLEVTLKLMTAYVDVMSVLPKIYRAQLKRISPPTYAAENNRKLLPRDNTFSEFMRPIRLQRPNQSSHGDGHLSEENKIWMSRLGSEIMKSVRVGKVETANIDSQRSEDLIYDQLDLFSRSMEEILCNARVNISASMCAARIYSLFDNLNAMPAKIDFNFASEGDTRGRTQEVQAKKTWEAFLKNAFRIVDSVSDESIGRNSITYHAIVDSLCKVKDMDALDQAYQVITEMESEGCKIMPETWSSIVSAATLISSQDDLLTILFNVESKSEVALSPKIDPLLIRALMFANARLHNGLRSLELFQMLRASNSEIGIKAYYWVVNALYHFRPDPQVEDEYKITRNPENMCRWFLREMHIDGIRADEGIVRLLMKLYLKRCQMHKSRDSIDKAQSFIETFTTEGYMDHSRVQGTEEMYSDIIKAACLANDEERALEILESMEMWYNIKPTAISYEPIVYNYSTVKGSRGVAQDILTMMLNQNVKISTNIVDTLVDGYLKPVEDSIEALDLAQELYNMHAVRPSPSKLLDILDISLRKKDIFEARRVVVVIKQMFESSELPDPGEIPPIHMISRMKASKYIEEPYAYKATSYLISDVAIQERFKSYGLQLS